MNAASCASEAAFIEKDFCDLAPQKAGEMALFPVYRIV